jgi:hypothetical protein
MSYQYFIYKPQLMDDNYDCYHVTDLKNGNATLLIKDPINNSSCKIEIITISSINYS